MYFEENFSYNNLEDTFSSEQNRYPGNTLFNT